MDQNEYVRRAIRDNARLRIFRTRFPSCYHCGENRPPALVLMTDPIVCYEWCARASGRSSSERHHIAGRSNDPFTILLSGNDHRCLTDLQAGWPPKTLRNPYNSPLLKIAGWYRGEGGLYLISAEYRFRLARGIEELNEALERRFGTDLWKRIALR